MKIVVIEGFTINPGDLRWDALKALGDCTIYERTPADKIVARCRDADIVLTNKAIFSAEVFAQLPRLQYLGVMATGYNVIDIEAARVQGVVVTNVPAYGTHSVAQMVFAHLLNLTQRVAHHHQTVAAGRWAKTPDFCYWDFPLVELHGLTMGILGLGSIGSATAKIARGFGMKVIFHTPHPPTPLPCNTRPVDLKTLFRESDVLSLHCPLSAETRHIVNAERLALMKPTTFLINTSRGPLIDETALLDALNSGKIAGAGLDVLEIEPPVNDHPLYHAKNCFITPHIGWATRAARQRLLDTVVANVKAFIAGNPTNIVSYYSGKQAVDV